MGNITCSGILDMSGTNGNARVWLYGNDNKINSFIYGIGSFNYASLSGTQPVLDLVYYNLYFYNGGNHVLSRDLEVVNQLVVQAESNLDLKYYDLIVNGAMTLSGILYKYYPGNILVKGLFTANTNVQLWGNPDVELRGGLTIGISNPDAATTGTGIWKFTTNNQEFIYNYDVPRYFQGKVIIDSDITLSLHGTGSRNFATQFFQKIDGVSYTGMRGTI